MTFQKEVELLIKLGACTFSFTTAEASTHRKIHGYFHTLSLWTQLDTNKLRQDNSNKHLQDFTFNVSEGGILKLHLIRRLQSHSSTEVREGYLYYIPTANSHQFA